MDDGDVGPNFIMVKYPAPNNLKLESMPTRFLLIPTSLLHHQLGPKCLKTGWAMSYAIAKQSENFEDHYALQHPIQNAPAPHFALLL